MKKLIFALFCGLLIMSCGKDNPITVPKDEIEDIEPTSDGKIEVVLSGVSNLQDYIQLSYAIVGMDGLTEFGTFKNFPTSRKFEAQEGTIKVALFAEKIADFPSGLFSSSEGVTFSVISQVSTPDDGKSVTWCGLESASVQNENELYEKTIKAINDNNSGAVLGTGKSKHLRYTVKKDSDGKYLLNLEFASGNLF